MALGALFGSKKLEITPSWRMSTGWARPALFAFCIVSAAIVVAETMFMLPSSRSAGRALDLASIDETLPADLESLTDEILDRPLFSSSREAVEQAAPEAQLGVQPPVLQSRLTGVIIQPGGREALFQHPGQKPVPVKTGGKIDGWTVKEIQFDRVMLMSVFGDQTVMLDKVGSGTASGTAANQTPSVIPRAPGQISVQGQFVAKPSGPTPAPETVMSPLPPAPEGQMYLQGQLVDKPAGAGAPSASPPPVMSPLPPPPDGQVYLQGQLVPKQ